MKSPVICLACMLWCKAQTSVARKSGLIIYADMILYLLLLQEHTSLKETLSERFL